VNTRRVPTALAESLMSGVNALATQKPVCLPAVPTTTTTEEVATPPPAPPHPKHEKHEKHHEHEHKGKHH
jgi:hypothetical protein